MILLSTWKTIEYEDNDDDESLIVEDDSKIPKPRKCYSKVLKLVIMQ